MKHNLHRKHRKVHPRRFTKRLTRAKRAARIEKLLRDELKRQDILRWEHLDAAVLSSEGMRRWLMLRDIVRNHRVQPSVPIVHS